MQRIFIGDVQGCSDELEDLLERAESHFGNDFELWVAGDLVNRGPDNLRPLERVRALVEAGRAQYVLGNHELFLIAVALGVRTLRPNDSVGDVLESAEADEWVDWLRQRPLAVSGTLGDQPFVLLHASAHPDWDLPTLLGRARAIEFELSASRERARALLAADERTPGPRDDLGRLTRCRSVPAPGDWSSEEPDGPGRSWHASWSERGHDYGIVYGHWARQGLHLAPGLRGLDTGCVHHGRGRDGFLTAWLPDPSSARPFDGVPPADALWQVPARRRYYRPADSAPAAS